jgi:hypothetical protein
MTTSGYFQIREESKKVLGERERLVTSEFQVTSGRRMNKFTCQLEDNSFSSSQFNRD